MAYNVPGWGTLKANSGLIRIGFIFDGGQDRGAQFAQANPTYTGTIRTTDHQISKINGVVLYSIQVENVGNFDTTYTLCGGGVT